MGGLHGGDDALAKLRLPARTIKGVCTFLFLNYSSPTSQSLPRLFLSSLHHILSTPANPLFLATFFTRARQPSSSRTHAAHTEHTRITTFIMVGVNRFNQTHVVANPYAPNKNSAKGPVLCETCDRTIPFKDWPAHERSKKHNQAKDKIEKGEKEEKAAGDRTDAWVDGQAEQAAEGNNSWADEATNAAMTTDGATDWNADPVDGGDWGNSGGDAAQDWGNSGGNTDGYTQAPTRGYGGGSGGYGGNGGGRGNGGSGCYHCGKGMLYHFQAFHFKLTISQTVTSRATALRRLVAAVVIALASSAA